MADDPASQVTRGGGGQETIVDLWLAGMSVGARTLGREPTLGLKRLLLPVSYWRSVEFAYVFHHLATSSGDRILDLGSPKDLAFFLARRRSCEVVAVDILPEAIEVARRYARAMGIRQGGPGGVRLEIQDGRALPYATSSFAAAYSVSVLEHIPESGDSDAVRELVRVVRPGGLVIVTVPFDYSYRETFVERDVYERERSGKESVFFERHYDAAMLRARLLGPAQAEVVSTETWGEGSIRVERWLHRVGVIRTLLSPFEGVLAALCLHRVDSRKGVPMAAFFTLRKPGST